MKFPPFDVFMMNLNYSMNETELIWLASRARLRAQGWEVVPFDEIVRFSAETWSFDDPRRETWFFLKDGDTWESLGIDFQTCGLNWPAGERGTFVVVRPIGAKDEDELTKQMKFFFGCKPTDPSKLPPPPKPVMGAWPEPDWD